MSGASSPAATAALAALGVRLGVLRRITNLTHYGLSAIVHCTASCHATISLVATAKDKGLKGTVAAASVRLGGGRASILTMKPSRKNGAKLSKLSTVQLQVVIVVATKSSTRRYVDLITVNR